jgi:aryl-alcohol dehydrogenase-like predicted oxidoreductase
MNSIKSCERLKVDKLPLVQFFWSNYDIKRYVDVALMLTELKEEGLIGEIGATNFDLTRLKELKDAGVPLVSHQVQLSCLDQRPVQSGMSDWCAENGISLIAFGTVGSGILSEKYLNRDAPSQEEKNTSSMKMYSQTASRFGSWNLVQDLLKTMEAVASDVRASGRCENADISNIAQRYVLDTKGVASVLVGVRNRNHIDSNVKTHSFDLTQGERDAISSVVAKRKGPSGDVWDLERGNLPGKR